MTVKIDATARIEKVRFQPQGTFPAGDPESGYGWLYFVTGSANGGMYFENDAGMRIGPFITGSTGGTTLSNSNLTITASGTTSAAVNTRYFVDISGLVGNAYFALPAGVVGDVIELSVIVGDDTYQLIIKGDTSITINGGSAATEWSRVFISGEVIKFIAQSTTNWVVAYDGRIGQKARYTTNAGQSFNSASTDIVNFEDLVYDTRPAVTVGASWKFTCYRAGYYRIDTSILFTSTTNWNAGEVAELTLYKNNAAYSSLSRPTSETTGVSRYIQLAGNDVILLAVGDYIDIRANQGSGAALALHNDGQYNYVDVCEV